MMSSQQKTPGELIHAFPFFAGLDEATYREILARGQSRRFARGESLFDEGEPCKGLFLVQSGVVKIFKLNEQGREQIIHLQRAGDAVAELPLFDGRPYPASASAMEDAVLLCIPKAAFDDLLRRYPQICHAVIAALAQRLRKMVGLVEDLSLRQVRQRLARLLLEEARGRESFPLPFTNEELAAQLGSVRDVISRTLSALQVDGRIALAGRRVTVLDHEALQEDAG